MKNDLKKYEELSNIIKIINFDNFTISDAELLKIEIDKFHGNCRKNLMMMVLDTQPLSLYDNKYNDINKVIIPQRDVNSLRSFTKFVDTDNKYLDIEE